MGDIKAPTEMPWRTDRPPNETWVEVRDGETILEAKAFYGRDGYSPHWHLRDGGTVSHYAFSEWRALIK